MRMVTMFRAALAALALLACVPAQAQTVVQLPQFTAPRTVLDIGNGPTEIKMVSGSMSLYTAQSSGAAGNTLGASSTTLPMAATITTQPCVGCIISGTGITSGTTVTASTTTNITLSSAMSVGTGVTVSWGASCGSTQPTAPVIIVQAGVGADLPFYTQARVCAWGGTGPGGQFLSFAIGAH